mmetsp:Transcript_40465/g.114601  ORF Transcript_40465/g.114601 Transcript_40465/m.114601 type:complete len:911 (+) Transcript_40465:443-3175(+)
MARAACVATVHENVSACPAPGAQLGTSCSPLRCSAKRKCKRDHRSCGVVRDVASAARLPGAAGAASHERNTPAWEATYTAEALEWLTSPDEVEVTAACSPSAPLAVILPGSRAMAAARSHTNHHHQQQSGGTMKAVGAAVLGRAEAEFRKDEAVFGVVSRQVASAQPTAGISPAASLGHDLLLLVIGFFAATCIQPFLAQKTVAKKAQQERAAQYFPKGEPVEWVNMCFRKLWRVYQRGLERWIVDLLQPVFDSLIDDNIAPEPLRRLKILEFTLDHQAPTFANMRRQNSRKDSDVSGVVDCRYTGGAKMLLQIEMGMGSLPSVKIPVMVSDLDFQGKLWIKLRLAPMCPWIGTIFLAFVGPPRIQVQLAPYNRVPLMRVPILQKLLAKLLIEDLPGLMVLPQRIEIVVPPALTSVAEAAVGRDAIMKAVATAVLQADTVEANLASALPLGPQGAAGGVSLPDSFVGEVAVVLREGRNLPVWGTSISSNPWCRVVLGEQAFVSKRNRETSKMSDHWNPVWDQEFQFLVQDPATSLLKFYVKDSHLTGKTEVGFAKLPLIDVPDDRPVSIWIPLESPTPGQGMTEGELLVDVCYKAFEDDDGNDDPAYASFMEDGQENTPQIVDIKTAADASSRANVAQSAAMTAVAVTMAAAARTATRAAQAAGNTTVRAAQAAGSTTMAAANQLSKVSGLGSSDSSEAAKDRRGNSKLPPPEGSPTLAGRDLTPIQRGGAKERKQKRGNSKEGVYSGAQAARKQLNGRRRRPQKGDLPSVKEMPVPETASPSSQGGSGGGQMGERSEQSGEGRQISPSSATSVLERQPPQHQQQRSAADQAAGSSGRRQEAEADMHVLLEQALTKVEEELQALDEANKRKRSPADEPAPSGSEGGFGKTLVTLAVITTAVSLLWWNVTH